MDDPLDDLAVLSASVHSMAENPGVTFSHTAFVGGTVVHRDDELGIFWVRIRGSEPKLSLEGFDDAIVQFRGMLGEG